MKAALCRELLTYEDITRLPNGNYEVIDGERRDMTPTGFEHGDLEGRFYAFLTRRFEGKGYVAVGEIGILISRSPLRIRAADVVYISKAKTAWKPKGILEIPPDLIIEIVSESNTQSEMTEKVKDYLSIGVERVVLVDPQTRTVSAYQKGKNQAFFCDFDSEFALYEGLSLKMSDLLSDTPAV
jgi:Uma2 family endonuclease